MTNEHNQWMIFPTCLISQFNSANPFVDTKSFSLEKLHLHEMGRAMNHHTSLPSVKTKIYVPQFLLFCWKSEKITEYVILKLVARGFQVYQERNFGMNNELKVIGCVTSTFRSNKNHTETVHGKNKLESRKITFIVPGIPPSLSLSL